MNNQRSYRFGHRHHWLSGLGVVAALAVADSLHAANTTVMVCDLRGAQEVPPTPSGARGCGRFVINTNTNTIAFHITYGGLTGAETAAHFHLAPPGASGGVKIGLPPGQPKIGSVTYMEADEPDILAGRWYVNIHTTAFPGGEIRGQMNSMSAVLDGIQETPPNTTPSRGWGTFHIDTCANKLDYYIFIENLSGPETGAHIHGMALHTVAAGVVHPLPGGMVKAGTWFYSESQERAILAGQTYVNIHTGQFPGGEIRGQITPNVGPIDGQQETPPNGSPASGSGFFAIDPPSATLSYYVGYGGLTAPETASHIHGFAPPGAAAGVLTPLPPGSPKIGTWAFGGANLDMVQNGFTYVNIHTGPFPGGEIRGQILFPPPRCLGDVNCDGNVNVSDLLTVINMWGPCPASPTPCPADTNYDGAVNVSDLLNVINTWGKCP